MDHDNVLERFTDELVMQFSRVFDCRAKPGYQLDPACDGIAVANESPVNSGSPPISSWAEPLTPEAEADARSKVANVTTEEEVATKTERLMEFIRRGK